MHYGHRYSIKTVGEKQKLWNATGLIHPHQQTDKKLGMTSFVWIKFSLDFNHLLDIHDNDFHQQSTKIPQ